jgi:flavin-dependent dehydrogenase
MFDVLIAGAGPAGSVAAVVLARAGARVLVLDRATFPRHKLCGDTVNPGARAVLAGLRLSSITEGALPIDGMVVTAERGVRIEARYSGAQGHAITRTVMDAALVAAAVGAGAHLEQGVLVYGPLLESSGAEPAVTGLVVKGRNGRPLRIPAPIVIAADGRHSRVARAIGLSGAPRRPRRWAVGAYFSDVAGLGSCGEMHVRRGHYIGVAPMPGGLANACVVTANRDGLHDPSSLLLGALAGDPQLRERFAAARLASVPVSLGPLAVDCSVAGARGLLLAGDASGFVDPMTGDGLRFAFRGAELAALEAMRALEHGSAGAHLRLLEERRREFTRKWQFNRGLRALVGSPLAVRAAGLGAVLAPRLLHHVVAYAGDVRAA